MRCLTCKYDLRNLTEHRCPECGRAFDPKDRSTFDVYLYDDIPGWVWLLVILGCLILFGWLFIYPFLSKPWPVL